MREALADAAVDMSQCLDANEWTLSTKDLIASVHYAAQLRSWIEVVQARLVRECEGRGIPRAEGATSAAVWLRQTTRISDRAAGRVVRLGKALHTHQELGRAVTGGLVNTEQAAVIADTLDALHKVELDPTDGELLSTKVPQDTIDEAGATLIDFADFFEPHHLATIGERILSLVAPEIGERADAAALKRQQAAARAARRLHLTPSHGGRVRISGWLDTEDANHVAAALDPLSKPLPGADGPDPRTAGQRRADALVEVCRHVATGCAEDGGGRPQVIVTVAYDALKRRLGTGSFDLGGNLHPEAVRRLACDAHVIPAVLDGSGLPLDVGRAKRLVTGAMRQAVELRDGGCAFPGCDRPRRWAQAHHIVHWADGGPTSLANSVLLCGYHHRLIHRGQWEVRMARDGLPEFLPPTYLDPARRPRRNVCHRRP
ncbi:HNH endonuclease [Virgisporangium aliadipatigenens]|uniref:HNH endonuclease n=1 Tax=Virgisporangium aliadipatigenens TaxID=741659 RepID=A0A8J3YH50_9ACTN|nr:HNH endonuclease signature motif containing protein [Virgisporangium aliadipatigenens]GIJ44152.1 HNH endonuclease [Virgisporangium aliadipatigenens]